MNATLQIESTLAKEDGQFTYRDGVAVIQLVFFLGYLVLGIILCLRHGFKRSNGWIAIVTLALLRVIGAGFQIATVKWADRTTYGGALICQGIGLAPLTLLNMGTFFRLNTWTGTLSARFFSALSIAIIIGIALGIYGGWSEADSSSFTSNTELKVSVIIYIAVYVVLFGLLAVFIPKKNQFPKAERKTLMFFALASPFMIARFAYSVIGDFATGDIRLKFSQLVGNVTIFLCMAVIEEIIIVAIFIIGGLGLKELPQELQDKPEDRLSS